MKKNHDLAKLKWTLCGWHPYGWYPYQWNDRKALSGELSKCTMADAGPVPMDVPGSVQQALRAAGLLPDWNVGENSRLCEWVENRHWTIQATLPPEWTRAPGRKILRCNGLDYQGRVFVNTREAGTFGNAMIPHVFDLTELLGDGPCRLTIVLTEIPDYLGMFYWSSKVRHWKPRFNYVWDWMPRLVQVGIWDDITLEIDQGDSIDLLRAWSDYDFSAGLGSVTVNCRLSTADAQAVELALLDGRSVVQQQVLPVEGRKQFEHRMASLAVDPWQPHGHGSRKLYRLRVRLLGAGGALLDEQDRPLGFREVVWKQCQGAPPGAEAWICCINGRDTFLQGVNWVPIRSIFADVTEQQYRQRLGVYRDLGVNLLRVWGGAVLEREPFYRLCDEMGLLVWQEFPLSSSGFDNAPPDDPQLVGEMSAIATSYIQRRQHHPALLLWCGGNELQTAHDGGPGGGKPLDRSHPMLAEQARVVAALDPTRRFLPTSSSGPVECASRENFGKGWHHDVHGPWLHDGPLNSWQTYWDNDDALFRSETGMPGASPAKVIRAFCGPYPPLPANHTNPMWMLASSSYLQGDEYLAQGGNPEDLAEFVAWSQKRQADALAYAVETCKRRFPACGGVILWMGHDSFPMLCSPSILDFNGQPKPAALAIGKIFRAARVLKPKAGGAARPS